MQGWIKEAGEDHSKHWKREVEREEEKTVIKRRCVNPISSDVFEELCPKDESDSVEDSCGFSVYVPTKSLGVLVSPSAMVCLGEDFSRFLIVSLLSRSPFLSLESVKPSLLKVKSSPEEVPPMTGKEDSGSGLWS